MKLVAGVDIGGVGGISTGVTPEIGLAPTAWDASGYIVEGTWYGESIPQNAFYNKGTSGVTWKLQKLLVAGSLKTIEGEAFSNCRSLTSINLPEGLTYIGSYVFYYCMNLVLTSLPESLTEIDSSAFYFCKKLAITNIPAGVTTIKNKAFGSCTGVSELTFNGKPSTIASDVFTNCSSLLSINVPWAEGEVANAPWGATSATINYNYTGG